MLLHGHQVLALNGAIDGALARFMASLGAQLIPVTLDELEASVSGASFLIESQGLTRLADLGWSRQRLEQLAPQLIHVSITPFGSTGPVRTGWAMN